MTSFEDGVDAAGQLRSALEVKIRGKAKPIGALGRIEELALGIGMARQSLSPTLGKAMLIVFAGDHGITVEGVTAYPSAVTREIAKLVLAGTSGASICARSVGADVVLVDAGLIEPLDLDDRSFLPHRIGNGTANFRQSPAMRQDQVEIALKTGEIIADRFAKDGVGIFAFGEIGIGNSSSAAVVGHALTGVPLSELVGPGAGVPALGLGHKLDVLEKAYERWPVTDCREVLRQFGGFEMVMMAGAMIGAAKHGIVIVDGFIATAVAIAARAMDPAVLEACVFAHVSPEPGHRALLDHLGVTPLFDLGMRLGEGSGAVLAIPLVRAAERLLSEMADLPGEHPE